MDSFDGGAATTGGGRKYRRWSLQDKLRIVSESQAPGASVARVALANGVNANQVHGWRQLHQRGLLGGPGSSPLLAVRLVTEPQGGAASQSAAAASGVIEVEAGRGRLRLVGAVDGAALRVVLEALLR